MSHWAVQWEKGVGLNQPLIIRTILMLHLSRHSRKPQGENNKTNLSSVKVLLHTYTSAGLCVSVTPQSLKSA